MQFAPGKLDANLSGKPRSEGRAKQPPINFLRLGMYDPLCPF
jgi:hypothetical protein